MDVNNYRSTQLRQTLYFYLSINLPTPVLKKSQSKTKHVPSHILAPGAVTCDILHLRARWTSDLHRPICQRRSASFRSALSHEIIGEIFYETQKPPPCTCTCRCTEGGSFSTHRNEFGAAHARCPESHLRICILFAMFAINCVFVGLPLSSS